MMYDAGQLTDPGLEVHHGNHVRTENVFSNLEVKTSAQHALDHAEERGWVINQYGEWAVKPREQRANARRPVRHCERCGVMISLALRRDAVYCGSQCQVAAWKERHRESPR